MGKSVCFSFILIMYHGEWKSQGHKMSVFILPRQARLFRFFFLLLVTVWSPPRHSWRLPPSSKCNLRSTPLIRASSSSCFCRRRLAARLTGGFCSGFGFFFDMGLSCFKGLQGDLHLYCIATSEGLSVDDAHKNIHRHKEWEINSNQHHVDLHCFGLYK